VARFPRDKFDDLPRRVSRVGAHRTERPRGRGWIAFGWAVASVAVLTSGGLLWLAAQNPDSDLFAGPRETPTPEPTVVETMEPVTDPAAVDAAFLETLTITVLNGTPTDGLAATVADQISAAGWPLPGRAAADNRSEERTIVYYSSPEQEGIARGLMLLVGASDVQLTDAFPIADITVVVGSDYTSPAQAPDAETTDE